LDQRHAKIKRELGSDSWNFYEVDASRMDMHVTKLMLSLTHELLKVAFPGATRELAFFHLVQIRTLGSHVCGVPYVVDGQRCSGDADTSFGNTMLSLLMITDALCRAGVHEYKVFIEGDDVMVAVRNEPNSFKETIVTVGAEFGQELKVVRCNTMVECTFLGRHYYFHHGEVYSFGQPMRALEKIHVSTSFLAGGKARPGLAQAKMMSILTIERNTPILSVYSALLLDAYRNEFGASLIYDKEEHHRMRLAGKLCKRAPIPDHCRYYYCMVTGIAPTDQIRLENVLRERFAKRVPWTALRLSDLTFGVDRGSFNPLMFYGGGGDRFEHVKYNIKYSRFWRQNFNLQRV
jgi:hypothetical protein